MRYRSRIVEIVIGAEPYIDLLFILMIIEIKLLFMIGEPEYATINARATSIQS